MARSGRLELDISVPIPRVTETRAKLLDLNVPNFARPPAPIPTEQPPNAISTSPVGPDGSVHDESHSGVSSLKGSASRQQPEHTSNSQQHSGLQSAEANLLHAEIELMYNMQALRASITGANVPQARDAEKFESARSAQKAMVDNIMHQISSLKNLHKELKSQAVQLHTETLERARTAHQDLSDSKSIVQSARHAAALGLQEISEQLKLAREKAASEMRTLELEYLDAKEQHSKRLQELEGDFAKHNAALKAEQTKDLAHMRQSTEELLALQTKQATAEAREAKAQLERQVQEAKAELQFVRSHKLKTIVALEAAARGAGWACTAHERAEQRAAALQAALRRSRAREKELKSQLLAAKRDLGRVHEDHMHELIMNAGSGISSSELRRAQHEARAAQSSLEDTFGKLERTRSQNKQMRQEMIHLQQELAMYKRQLRGGKAQAAGSSASSPTHDSLHIRKQLVDANATIRALKKEITKLQQELSASSQQCASAERRVQQVQAAAGKLQQRLDLLKSAGATPAPPRSSMAADDRSAMQSRALPLAEFKSSVWAAAASDRATAALKATRWALALAKVSHLRQRRKWHKQAVRSAMRQWRLVAAHAALGASRSDMRFALMSGAMTSSRSASATVPASDYSPSKS